MAKLADVVYGSSEKLDNLFNGQTVSGHTYNENDLYIEELGDDIELGATGSGLSINNSNQLIVIGKEDTSNKVIAISDQSTDTQYPSAKAVYTGLTQREPADNTILKQANVVNNTSSTATVYPLSANMGKELQDQVNNLKNIGRFLSIWNASTGTPTSEPTVTTYSYKVGDYYRVGTVGTKNPAPNSTYVIGGTNWVEGSSLGVGDVIYVSNIEGTTATWVKQSSGGGGTVQDVQVAGTSVLSSGSGIANIQLDSNSLEYDTENSMLKTKQLIKIREIT